MSLRSSILSATLLASLVAGLCLTVPANAQQPPSRVQIEKEQLDAARLETWRNAIAQTPRAKAGGCFEATYPDMEWREVPCVEAPKLPMPPKVGPRPFVVGNGSDVSAEVPTAGAFISTGIGSFDSVAGVTSLSSPIGNEGAPVNDAYTLQLNTDFFASTACAGSPNAGCRGWEQFVFANDGANGYAFIQYWLLRYNTTCPGGWTQFQFTGETDIYCYRNSNGVSVPNQPAGNLGQLTLTGAVSATGDSITLASGVNSYSVDGTNSVNAAAGWRLAEFGVFGYGGNSDGGGQATFNTGSTIQPRTRIFYGGTEAPGCSATGYTAETNNLNFVSPAPDVSGPGPAVFSHQSTATPAVANCDAATSVGDTHLTTFDGLLYDFQASGDFILAQIGREFMVQARQVSGAPTWPNASVNQAVAVQMGRTHVTICLGRETPEVYVDGSRIDLKDGTYLELAENVDMLRTGNIYLMRGQRGDSVRAVLYDHWMDVTVGLGRSPVKVRGLLFNTERFGLETREGERLSQPLSFKTLYGIYGRSWRVSMKASLLADCGAIEGSNPERPFFAKDLDREQRQRAEAICREAGVREGPLLEACTLDVVVINHKDAAGVFVAHPQPTAVLRPTS